eukprot:scaffold853_cov104-Skeletonema_marinoi.AAC.10
MQERRMHKSCSKWRSVHRSKVKLCNSEGCTNYAQRGGVCMKDQRLNYASKKDVQIQLSKEECAEGIVQRSNCASQLGIEECAI